MYAYRKMFEYGGMREDEDAINIHSEKMKTINSYFSSTSGVQGRDVIS